MHPFAPGDRVVAINTDMSAPIRPDGDRSAHPFVFPDGSLRGGVVYHVETVRNHSDGSQGVFLTGIRVLWGKHNIPWDSSRFRQLQQNANAGYKRARKALDRVALDAGKNGQYSIDSWGLSVDLSRLGEGEAILAFKNGIRGSFPVAPHATKKTRRPASRSPKGKQ